ncbi:MAG: hypothetical protein H0U74_13180 [Bradymonadaceae bacterium]|nr:hypothetical protein [Lujinxingiaceae bacterium]
MTQDPLNHRRHFSALVEYLDEFSERQRQLMATAYGAPSAFAVDIAQTWFADPEAFLAVVDKKIGSTQAWRLLEEMAFEHDLPVEVDWIAKRFRTRLADLGLLNAQRADNKVLEGYVPAVIAALLAPKLRGVRPSLPILLGRKSHAELLELARANDVSTSGSKLDVVMALSEHFALPETVDALMNRLPDPEWIAAAMMVLELGGICYWQEIFGYDLDTNIGEERKVVPLMRSHERDEERHIAETLVEIGILYRVEDEDSPYPMVAVPEELWTGLWRLGRGWLLEWTANTFYALSDQAMRKVVAVEPEDLQAALKLVIVEAEHQKLALDEDEPSAAMLAHFEAISDRAAAYWEPVLSIGLEMRVLDDDPHQNLLPGVEHRTLLDMNRAAFIRQALMEWCTGFAASKADEHLGVAIGLDDSWRERVLALLIEREEFVPLWMHYEGVPSNTTGAGCLRNIEDGVDEMLLMEMGLTNGFVWSIKLIWLDLLSMIEAERWYTIGALTEMFQLTACMAMFSQLIHLLEHPHFSFYLPLQRASFFTDAYHGEQFQSWVYDVLRNLFIPLGLAVLSEDEESVWIDSKNLRIESPTGWPDEQRIELLRELLDDDKLDFRIPSATRPGLRSVSNALEKPEKGVNLSEPIDVVRKQLKGKKVVRFDGHKAFFA